jgi:hypothetical protein
MKLGFNLWILKPKSSQSRRCTHIHQTSWKSLNKCRLPAIKLMGQERSADGGIHGTRDHNNIISILWNAKKMHRAIQNKRCGMPTSGVVLLHDNVHPYIAARPHVLLDHFNWEFFAHPPYNPDLTLSNYHLFTYLKNWFGRQRFNNELMKGVKTWLCS